MEWQDEGIVVARRRHGESAAVVTLLTRAHGRHAGLVRGGAGRRAGGLYQAGTLVSARWRARLAEHLGSFVCEMSEAIAARLLDDPAQLDALGATCAIVETALPEREPHPKIFLATLDLLRRLDAPGWPVRYVRWEIVLLAELGFGLDLTRCVATGSREDLAYVSPRTGRAVSAAAGEPYGERLLRLPQFLLDESDDTEPGQSEIAAGLALTGHFLERSVFAPHGRPVPAARMRLVERLGGSGTISGNYGIRSK